MEVSRDINLEAEAERQDIARLFAREKLGPNATDEKVERLRSLIQPKVDEFCRRVVELYNAGVLEDGDSVLGVTDA